jgi:hypothetical protein
MDQLTRPGQWIFSSLRSPNDLILRLLLLLSLYTAPVVEVLAMGYDLGIGKRICVTV